MNCVGCGSASVAERREVTAQGYQRFRAVEHLLEDASPDFLFAELSTCGSDFGQAVSVKEVAAPIS